MPRRNMLGQIAFVRTCLRAPCNGAHKHFAHRVGSRARHARLNRLHLCHTRTRTRNCTPWLSPRPELQFAMRIGLLRAHTRTRCADSPRRPIARRSTGRRHVHQRRAFVIARRAGRTPVGRRRRRDCRRRRHCGMCQLGERDLRERGVWVGSVSLVLWRD